MTMTTETFTLTCARYARHDVSFTPRRDGRVDLRSQGDTFDDTGTVTRENARRLWTALKRGGYVAKSK
jgi:hypothetical protein